MAKRELQFVTTTTTAILHISNLPWSKTEQRSHVPPSYRDIAQKPKSRVILLRRLAGSGWGADAKTLQIAVLSLMYSTSEYCAPI